VPGIEPFSAPCESELDDGGWTVIERQHAGTVNFDRSWNEYRNGFGDLREEFFIGLEKLHKMTAAEPQDLLIYFEKHTLETEHTRFNGFLIGSEEEDYVLKSASRISGSYMTLESSLGKKFTTFDRDNDKYLWGNCAKDLRGGWWFGDCHEKSFGAEEFYNLNGVSYNERRIFKSLLMMIRPTRLSLN